MAISTVRRLAADVLNVGTSRIRIDASTSENRERISKAASREDVRALIKDKIVFAAPALGCRRHVRKRQRREGRRRVGRTKRRKEEWAKTVRAQRKMLRFLVNNNYLDKRYKPSVYLNIKGNAFRSVSFMLSYLAERNMLDKSKIDEIKKLYKESMRSRYKSKSAYNKSKNKSKG